jgi:hypothetical protein
MLRNTLIRLSRNHYYRANQEELHGVNVCL